MLDYCVIDDGIELNLFVFRPGDDKTGVLPVCIYASWDFRRRPDLLHSRIEELRAGLTEQEVIEMWPSETDPGMAWSMAYNNLVTGQINIIADEKGVYPERMGPAGRAALYGLIVGATE